MLSGPPAGVVSFLQSITTRFRTCDWKPVDEKFTGPIGAEGFQFSGPKSDQRISGSERKTLERNGSLKGTGRFFYSSAQAREPARRRRQDAPQRRSSGTGCRCSERIENPVAKVNGNSDRWESFRLRISTVFCRFTRLMSRFLGSSLSH